MEIVNSIPALIRISVVFALVILLIRRKISLGNTFVLSSVSLGLLFNMSATDILRSFGRSMMVPQTMLLSVIVSLILIMSRMMETGGGMKALLNDFGGLIRNRKWNIVIFPALIGLLPMPGGAVFSAPMVRELGKGSVYSAARLSFVNYWFRHIWEYWWPLYPGILLTSAISGISLTTLMAILGPFTLVAFASGYGSLKQNGGKCDPESEINRSGKTALSFLNGLSPILMVIVIGLGLGIAFSEWMPRSRIAKELGLVIALLLAIGKLYATSGFDKTVLKKQIFDRDLGMMVYMVFSILIFKGIMEDSLAVNRITEELNRLNIPLVLIVSLLPFLVGMISGITIAFVGSTFPILIPLIQAADPIGFMPAYLMLGMLGGFTGVLLSPVHLCLTLSNGYFGVESGGIYRYLIPACIRLIVVGYAFFWILYRWMIR